MKKEGYDFIFEIEDFNILLDDIDSILKEKNQELKSLLNKTTIESIKHKEIKLLLSKVVSYQNSLKVFKNRLIVFKNSDDFNFLTNSQNKFVKDFNVKLNKYISESKKLINICLDNLNSDKEVLP